jgi:hypothetical protein
MVTVAAPATVAPTFTPPALPSDAPRIELDASATTFSVGETITVTGQAIGIGLPIFSVHAQDAGAVEADTLVEITYEAQVRRAADVSQIVELVSAQADLWQVVVALRGRAPGQVTVNVSATGEVISGGAYLWGGGGSELLTLEVAP